MKKRFLFFAITVVSVILCFSVSSFALTKDEVSYSEDIAASCSFQSSGIRNFSALTDHTDKTRLDFKAGTTLTITSDRPLGGLWFRLDYNRIYSDYFALERDDLSFPTWSVTYNGVTDECGQNGFLHEYCPLNADNVYSVTVTFHEDTCVSGLYVLPEGELPSWVQIWRPAEGDCDLLLISSHSDDDQLYFAGVVPLALAEGAEVQVSFFTTHWNKKGNYSGRLRTHELLDSLWSLGLTRYPDLGDIPDIYSIKGSLSVQQIKDVALARYAGGQTNGFLRIYTFDMMVERQVLRLRKYHPQVVVTHDINGEYGHGTHVLCTLSLQQAVTLAYDKIYDTASAEEYGVWNVPKTYIHLWDENRVYLAIDMPLELYGGKTAFRMSQEAFTWHPSQWSSNTFPDWLYGKDHKNYKYTKSTDIQTYTPGVFGLWRSTVGSDEKTDTFFDNIVFYSVQDRRAYYESLVTIDNGVTWKGEINDLITPGYTSDTVAAMRQAYNVENLELLKSRQTGALLTIIVLALLLLAGFAGVLLYDLKGKRK